MLALLLSLTLAASPELAHARHSVADAARAQAECWGPRECTIADELADAARAELEAATALATPTPPVHKSADPWQADYVEPFTSMDPVPEALEADAAFKIADLQTALDGLVAP